jgi:hypothetical protein
VNQGGVAVKNSPFRVYVSAPTDSSKVQVFGPGVEKGVKSNTPTHFNVDARDAGPGQMMILPLMKQDDELIDGCLYLGDLNVSITNEKNQPVPVQVDDNGDGTYSVGYTPSAPGPLKVNVLYAGKLIPKSPIAVQVLPHVDVSKVKVDGLDPSKFFCPSISNVLGKLYFVVGSLGGTILTGQKDQSVCYTQKEVEDDACLYSCSRQQPAAVQSHRFGRRWIPGRRRCGHHVSFRWPRQVHHCTDP